LTGKQKIGLALGSGSARGWAHIGVIRELQKLGIKPDVVCGSSAGALVGGIYVSGYLDIFEKWLRTLDKRQIFHYMDMNLVPGGGFVEGKRLINYFREFMGDCDIESLDVEYVAIATDLTNGREIWLRSGSIMDAIRASIAIPGFFTPVHKGDQWLVDGGLSNPVPVSVCRALGADVVIAVDVNDGMISNKAKKIIQTGESKEVKDCAELGMLDRWASELKVRANSLLTNIFNTKQHDPGLFDVLSSSMSIVQDRITRNRMADDPPEVLLHPRLPEIGLLEFDLADKAIREGRDCVKRHLDAIEFACPEIVKRS
jgi:NTE family protein